MVEKNEAEEYFTDHIVLFDKNPFCIMISVSDTGIGIPEDKINQVFDRFYRVSESSTQTEQGSGIGLAIIKKLVELQKGYISVKSHVKDTELQSSLLPVYLPLLSLENKPRTGTSLYQVREAHECQGQDTG